MLCIAEEIYTKKMQTKFIKSLLVLFLFIGASAVYAFPADSLLNEKQKNDSAVSMDKFREELSSKGEWIKVDSSEIDADETDEADQIDDNISRDYVWRPNDVSYDWNPYDYGCWVYTSSGWFWVSYYDYGWTTYHYGRWWWSVRLGWVWSPGYIWAPAWVNWYYWDGYAGWYPLSPRSHWGNGHYNISRNHWRERNWTFVHYKNFTRSVTKQTKVDGEKTKELLTHSKPVNDIKIYKNGTVTNEGPKRRDIEQSSGEKVKTYNVDNFSTVNRGKIKNGNNNTERQITRNDGKRSRNNEKGYREKSKNGSKNNGYKTWGKRNRGNGNNDNGTKWKGRNGNNGTKWKSKDSNHGSKGYNGKSHNGSSHGNGNNRSSSNHNGSSRHGK